MNAFQLDKRKYPNTPQEVPGEGAASNATTEELGWNCSSTNGLYHMRFATATSAIALKDWLSPATSPLQLAPNRTRIDLDLTFGPKLDPTSKVALEAEMVSCSDYKAPHTRMTRTGSYFGESGFLQWDKQAVVDSMLNKVSQEISASVWTSGVRNISVSKLQDTSMFRAFVDSRCGQYRYFQRVYFTFNDYPNDDSVRLRWGVFVSVGPQPLVDNLLQWLLLAGGVGGGILLGGMLYCCFARRCCCKSEDRALKRMTEPLLQDPYRNRGGSYGINAENHGLWQEPNSMHPGYRPIGKQGGLN